MLRLIWRLTKGYRRHPWRSPYLRWRIETWSGIDADSITPKRFFAFTWENRDALMRYLGWAAGSGRS